jgi:hypothetical protein
MSLGEAARARRWFRADYADAGADGLLPAGWFPILVTGAKPTMWIDCTGGADKLAPLYVDEHLAEPLFPSLVDFVGAIIRTFDEGLIRPHPEDARVPTFDAPALKGELRRLAYW